MQIAIISPIQAVRSGLRAMLSSHQAGSLPDDDPLPVSILEASGMGEIQSWLNEIDLLVIAGDAWGDPDLDQALLGHEDRLAVLLLVDDPGSARSLPSLGLRAWGVLGLDCTIAELNAAVSAIHEGLLVYSPAFSRVISPHQLAGLKPVDDDPLTEPLTQRETEVLQLLAQGLSNKQIAARLGISEHTVKFHVSSIYARLNSASRTEAVRVGVQRGLIIL